MNTLQNLFVLLVMISGIISFVMWMISEEKKFLPTIPGDGFRPAIPPTVEKTEDKSYPGRAKGYHRRDARGNWHPVTDVREGYFANGSALVMNERGCPQRVSRTCLHRRCG